MYNLSAAMAGEFVAAAKEMTEQITALGSNPLRPHSNAGNGENKERDQ